MLSVITPVYNGERFIEFCIKNVMEQKCNKIEHIIIDGGSTDGTIELIRKYADTNAHIRWISEKDKGQSDAMNKGILLAKGEILNFLNVDDYFEPNILNDIIEMFGTLPEPTLLVGNCNVWDDNGKLWFISKPSKINLTNILAERYFESFPMNPSAYFYHASLHKKTGLYKVDENFIMDIDFIIKAVQSANVIYIDKLFGNYRYLKGTKSYDDDKNGNNGTRIKAIVDYYFKQQPIYEQIKIRLLNKFFTNFQRIKHHLKKIKIL